MTKDEVLMMALEALKANDLLINGTEKAGGLAWCIDGYYSDCFDIDPINEQTEKAITAIKEALAQPEQTNIERHEANVQKFLGAPQPEQEPVAWRWENGGEDKWLNKYIYLDNGAPDYPKECEPLYTTPPQRTWVGLIDEDWDEIFGNALTIGEVIKATEAKLKEKNT